MEWILQRVWRTPLRQYSNPFTLLEAIGCGLGWKLKTVDRQRPNHSDTSSAGLRLRDGDDDWWLNGRWI